MAIRDVDVTITRETRAVSREGFGLPLVVGTAEEADFDYKLVSSPAGVTKGDVTDETLGTAGGTADDFLVEHFPVVEESETVRVNGEVYDRVDSNPDPGEYTIDYTTGEVDFEATLDDGDVVDADYQKDIGMNTDVYSIAQRIFAQTPSPPEIAVVWFDITTDTLASKLNDLVQVHDQWYFLLSEHQLASDVDDLAGWAAGNGKLYFVSMDEADLAGTLSSGTMELDRAVVLSHKKADEQFPAEGWVGVCAPQDPGSITWKFKQISGVGVSDYSPTQINDIKEDSGNVVVEQGGIVHTTEGTLLNGEFIDIIRSQDFMTARIRENVFFILANAGKIPFTDAGISQIVSGLESALMTCFNQGIIAEDEGGNPMYEIEYPSREEVSDADRANRLLSDVYFTVTLAGAIHKVEITGVLQV